MPRYAAVFFVLALGAIGVPGTSGFIGELLVLIAAFRTNISVAAIACLGMILSAAYMLWLYRRVFTGKLVRPLASGIVGTAAVLPYKLSTDLNGIEQSVFALLIAGMLLLGIYPTCVLTSINQATVKILNVKVGKK